MVVIKYKDREYYMSQMLKDNLDLYKKAVLKKNTSAVLIIDGRSGEGKTTLSMQVAGYLNDNFCIDDVCFTVEQFLNRLKQAKKGDVIIFDEAMVISSRSAMSLLNRAVVICMSQIRSKNIFVIFNINSIFDLDRNLSLHRADCLLHVYSEDGRLGNRGRYCVFPSRKAVLQKLYMYGKKYYSYARPKAVFVDKFFSHFLVDEEEYEKRKQESINKFIVKTTAKSSQVKIQRDKLIRYVRENYKLNNKQLAEIMGINYTTIQRNLKILKDSEQEDVEEVEDEEPIGEDDFEDN